MTEDLLSHDERLRLECLAQALRLEVSGHGSNDGSVSSIVDMAREFEAYIADPPEPAPQASKAMAAFGLGRYITEPVTREQTDAALDTVHRRLTQQPANGD